MKQFFDLLDKYIAEYFAILFGKWLFLPFILVSTGIIVFAENDSQMAVATAAIALVLAARANLTHMNNTKT